MGEDFVRFKCHHCNHCCTDVICLPTPWDVRRITKMTGKDPFDFIEFLSPSEVEDVDEDDPTWLDVNGKRYIMALQRDEKTGCTFLNNKTRLCSIYEARPMLCRLYPFKVRETKSGMDLPMIMRARIFQTTNGTRPIRAGMARCQPSRNGGRRESHHQVWVRTGVKMRNQKTARDACNPSGRLSWRAARVRPAM